ncbi:MAG: putative Ig domain-containing protein, partial [Spirochaetota bacterium]
KACSESKISSLFSKLNTSSVTIQYPDSPYTLSKDTAVEIIPSLSGAISNCTTAEDFPDGLSLDTLTCRINGTPTSTQAAQNYTITAVGANASVSTSIQITIDENPPSNLTYSESNYTYTTGISLVTNTPSFIGNVTSCVASPELPSGLSLAPTTCTISGTPSSAQTTTEYAIVASNSYGSTSTTLLITINDRVPTSLGYSGSPFVYTKDYAISPVNPTIVGTPSSYSITPTLPAGLSIDTATGQLSGTPAVLMTTPTDYTVTAKNSAGSTTTSFTIRITSFQIWSEIQNTLTGQQALGVSASETLTTFGSFTGSSNWHGGVLAPNGKIYSLPSKNSQVLAIDPTTNTTSLFGSLGDSQKKWRGGVLAANGKIYGIPGHSSDILVIDPDTNTTTTIATSSGNNKWMGGVLAPNGKIYGIPSSSQNVLVIDPDTDTATTFASLTSVSDKWYGGVLAPNGKIYAIPHSSTEVLVIDPDTNTTTTFATLTGNYKWRGGVLAPNGKIYGIPSDSTEILVIDPDTNTTTTFGSFTGTKKWHSGVLAPNGKIYAIPTNATNVLVIDTSTNTTMTFASLGGSLKWSGGILAPNGKIYTIPTNHNNILTIDPKSNGSWSSDFYTSPYFNKF